MRDLRPIATDVLALLLVFAVGCDEPAEPPPLASALPIPMFPPPPGSMQGVVAHIGVSTSLAVHVVPGIAEVVGSLSPTAIDGLVAEHLGELEFCYAHALEEHPGAHGGRLVATYTVRRDGTTVRPVAFAEDTVGLPALSECVAGSLAGWPYPTATLDTQIRLGLDFSFDPPPPG